MGRVHSIFVGSLVVGLSGLIAAQEATLREADEDDAYEFKADYKRLVAVLRPLTLMYHFGHLDTNGEFTEDRNFPPLRSGYVPFQMPRVHHITWISQEWSLKLKEPVYELRHGTLIKGHLEKGRFVPEVGSTVISFEDFRYTKSSPRIYNLPGDFVKKKRAGGQ